MLYDGAVTLTSRGDGTLMGAPDGALAPEAGVDYDITINGTTKSGTATAAGDDAVIQLMYGEGDMIMYGSNSGSVMFMCTDNYGEAGENTLRVAKAE